MSTTRFCKDSSQQALATAARQAERYLQGLVSRPWSCNKVYQFNRIYDPGLVSCRGARCALRPDAHQAAAAGVSPVLHDPALHLPHGLQARVRLLHAQQEADEGVL